MVNFVIKKDGTKVPFNSEKIKVGTKGAASEAGLSEQEAENLAEKILSSINLAFRDKEEVTTAEIRNKILAELDESQPTVAQSWRKYEEGKGE